jgi:hypothetical protein
MGNVNEYRSPVGCKVIEIAYVFQSCEGIQLQRMAPTFYGFGWFWKASYLTESHHQLPERFSILEN